MVAVVRVVLLEGRSAHFGGEISLRLEQVIMVELEQKVGHRAVLSIDIDPILIHENLLLPYLKDVHIDRQNLAQQKLS